MKARVLKSYLNLPNNEKEAINKLVSELVEKQVDKEEIELQKKWLQFACIVLNNSFGFGKKRLMMFLGGWNWIYRMNNEFKNNDEQTAFIEKRISKIFGKNGYPSKWVDSLEEI